MPLPEIPRIWNFPIQRNPITSELVKTVSGEPHLFFFLLLFGLWVQIILPQLRRGGLLFYLISLDAPLRHASFVVRQEREQAAGERQAQQQLDTYPKRAPSHFNPTRSARGYGTTGVGG